MALSTGSARRQRTGLTSLGLAGFQAELDQIAEQKDRADQRDRQARRAMLARIRGVDIENVEARYFGSLDPEVGTAINKRQVVHEEELLAEHEIGTGSWNSGPRITTCSTWSGWRPRRARSASSGPGSENCWASSSTALEREAMSIPPAGEEV